MIADLWPFWIVCALCGVAGWRTWLGDLDGGLGWLVGALLTLSIAMAWSVAA